MAEAPAASFAKVETPKPTNIVEKVKHYRSPEQKAKRSAEKRERQDRKRNERVSQRTWTRQEVADYAERRKKADGSYLNMLAHPDFQRRRADFTLEALAEKRVQGEILGNRGQGLTPAEQAAVLAKTYEELARLNPDLAEKCKREDIYFTQPDKNGNSRISYSEDPFMRAVDADAQARIAGSQDARAADQVYDDYYANYKGKANIYADIGHPGLRQARARAEARGNAGLQTTDAGPTVAAGQARPLEAASATVNLAEQQLKTDLARYAELSAIVPANMTFAQKNEMRQLHKAHEAQVASAQILADQFNNDPDMILQPAELDRLELYKAFLKTPDVTPPVPTATELKAQQQAQEAAYIQRHGPDSFTQLTALNVDFSTITEDQALAACRQAGWTGQDTDVRAFIHAGFEENTRIQNEIARASSLPADKMAIVDDLRKSNRMSLSDLANLIAFFIGEMAKSAIQTTTAVP